MVSLFYGADNKVSLIYYSDLPKELENKKHLKVEKLEEAEEKEGKISVLYANEEKYWYEYENKPLTEDELMEKRLKDMESTLSVFLGGM